MTPAFEIRPELFVESFSQRRRHGLAPLGIEESHIFAIDLLALLFRQIGARNVKIPILHEVVIGIAASRFSPTCKPHVTIRHQGTALVIRRALGFDLLDARFKITG